ncbi:MAG TPA: cysteine--tRNA ligase [Aridibacter sp.]|nr:cysteine--tRNA ligase [Aridibacter sp.]
MLKFHNTLSRQIEEFHPLDEGKAKVYICGPTVWNFAHIGNFRTFIFGDVLHRYLKFKGFDVTYVMNLTDVDDRIIDEAANRGIGIDEMTAPYVVAFHEDMAALNCLEPDVEPRATEHIGEMIDIISRLLEKGLAYESDGSIYYRITAFPDYGKLSKINFEGNIEGGSARVDTDKYEKEDARDFALWKLVEDPEATGWDAPFGRGRPGWHIECSAMSMKYLGETFDIHAGGIDLQFPHHENEIAQSEGATGKPFAKYWLHGEFLKIDNEKMAKSLKNDYTFRDILARGFSPLAIRYLLLSVPYGKQLNFTFEGLKGAESAVERLRNFRRLVRNSAIEDNGEAAAEEAAAKALSDFESVMDDDLNTSQALASIHNLVREVNSITADRRLSPSERDSVLSALEKFDSVLAIFGEDSEEVLDEEIDALIAEREEARKNRDFARADEIRDRLAELNIILADTKDGVRWKRG